VKAGRNPSGTQRYKCACGRTHSASQRVRSMVELTRLAAALLCRAGYSLGEASSILAISKETVRTWSNMYGADIVVAMEEIYDIPCFTHLANRTEQLDL